MLANYLIGIREGVEAALIVSILVSYLVKLGERKQVSKIFGGVSLAVLIAVALGIVLTDLEASAPANIEPAISGVSSLLAAGFVTWMIFWMARQSRAMAGNLRSQVDQAVTKSGWSLAVVAFLSVIREGVETSVLLWGNTQTKATDSTPIWGAILGLLTAAVLGYFMYKGALKINLGLFFKITGGFLIFVAAGIFAYGVGELQEIGWLPALTQHSYDLTAAVPSDSILDTVLRGTVTFNNSPTWLQTIAWFGLAVPTGILFARSQFKRTAK